MDGAESEGTSFEFFFDFLDRSIGQRIASLASSPHVLHRRQRYLSINDLQQPQPEPGTTSGPASSSNSSSLSTSGQQQPERINKPESEEEEEEEAGPEADPRNGVTVLPSGTDEAFEAASGYCKCEEDLRFQQEADQFRSRKRQKVHVEDADSSIDARWPRSDLKDNTCMNCNKKTSAMVCQKPEHELLPHDLTICNIVTAWLPLLDQVRARCVCRAWRDVILSPSRLDWSLANSDCYHPRLVMGHSGSSLATYHPQLGRWSVIPTPFSGRLVAASNGLFCFVTKDGCSPSIVVGNPITQQWKHLPAIPLHIMAHGPQLLTMTANIVSHSYKVVVLFGFWDEDATDAYLPFQYDSSVGFWKELSVVHASHLFTTSRTTLKPPNTLLCVDTTGRNVLSYNIDDNCTSLRQLELSDSCLTDHYDLVKVWQHLPLIASCSDRLFLAARCLGEKTLNCKLGLLPIVLHSCVGIWVMQADSGKWEFITKTPIHLLEQVVKGSDGTDFALGSNGSSQLYLILEGSSYMLAYDINDFSWALLPGCPSNNRLHHVEHKTFYESLLWAGLM